MKLQQSTRYAIWAVIELASRPNEQVRAQELAETYRISQNHLVRILYALTKANIVTSARGPGGGFTFCGAAGSGWFENVFSRTDFGAAVCVDII